MSEPQTMTVADLKEELSRLENDDQIYFGNGDLSFYRLKYRGEKLVSLEFNEIYSTVATPDE